MKQAILLLVLIFGMSCQSQVFPLRTYTDVPDNSYLKDISNELDTYIGTYKASWNGKNIQLNISKSINKYKSGLYIYSDFLIIKFKVTTMAGTVLFDNLALSNDDAKISGVNFKEGQDKYTLVYVDGDLCGKSGLIQIWFTDPAKTQLKFVYSEGENWLDGSCFYSSLPVTEWPEPLPGNIIFTKQ